MLTVHLLGQFKVTQDGEPVELPSRPAQSLLAWLILHPGIAHRREQIAGLLWPESNEENARSNLRHALWRLRRAIPDGFVEADNISIRWMNGAGWSMDVDRLQAPPRQPTGPDELIDSLTSYGGELLPGFYDEWVTLERERLIAIYENQMARLLDALFVARRGQEIVEWAEKWIAQGRTPEYAFRGLMSAHASLGDRTAALAAYQRCVDALERELSVPPSAETAALADSIRNSHFIRHPFDRRKKRPAESPTPAPAILSNLPAATTPLVGREREMATLVALLADPVHRLVTILGPGGMGKSRLALAAGHASLDHFADGVFLVELTALTNGEEIARAIGDALGYPFQNDSRPPRQQLLDYLRARKVLLLLDNFEHLLDWAELLIALLEAAPGLRLLVTSRERLRLHAETIFRLDGLACPASGEESAESFDTHSALTLFVQSVRRILGGYTPNQTQWSAVARICRIVGGMPLGIVLAASWVEHLPPAEIADEIAANIAFLGQDLRDLDPRHRTIEAVFEQSWRRLTEGEQQALMGLSVFAGGFDRAAAQAVADATLPILSRLVDKALVWRVGEARYDLHELIRQLARQKLLNAKRGQEVFAFHCRWFLGLAGLQEAKLKGREDLQAIQSLEIERENMRVAWQWAAENGEIGGMLGAVEALGIYYNRPGHWEDGEGLMGRALAGLDAPDQPQTQILRAWLLAWHGVFLHRTGQVSLARQHLSRLLEEMEMTALPADERRRLQAFVYLHRGGDLMTNRFRGETGNDLQQSLALFQEINDSWWEVHCLCMLSHWEIFNGQLRRGLERSENAAYLARRLGYRGGEITALKQMSFASEHMGHNEQGEQLAREARALNRDPSNRVNATQRLAFTLLATGKFKESATISLDELAWAESVGIHPRHIAFSRNNLARAYVHLGRFDEGFSLAEATVQTWKEAHGFEQPFLLRTVARALLAQGNFGEAHRLLQQTVESQRGVGNENIFPLGGALVDCAYPALALGDVNATRRTLIEGLRMAQRSEAFHFVCQALPAAALLLAKQGRLEEAAFVNGAIQRYPHLTGSHWYALVALEKLAELLAPLPADVRSAAEERGRAPKLPETTAELLTLLT